MLLPIQDKSIFLPGLGNETANLLEVRVASYQLGTGATAFWQLYKREDGVDTPLPLSGNAELTAEQFASWGQDDDWFARCIAQNLGFFPLGNE